MQTTLSPAAGEVRAASLDEPGDIVRHPAADAPLPATAPVDTWARLGAKPKTAASSTPAHPEHWVRVGTSKGKNSLSSSALAPPHFNIQLNNKYDILSVKDFPPLDDGSRVSPPSSPERFPSRKSHRQSQPVFTPAPQRSVALRTGRPSSFSRPPHLMTLQGSPPSDHSFQRPPRRAHSHLQRPPSLLVIGTSLVRHVAVRRGRTFCHPGASVNDIKFSALHLCDQYRSVSTLVLEAGVNDIRNQRSEELKDDFAHLVDTLLDTGKQLIILSEPDHFWVKPAWFKIVT